MSMTGKTNINFLMLKTHDFLSQYPNDDIKMTMTFKSSQINPDLN